MPTEEKTQSTDCGNLHYEDVLMTRSSLIKRCQERFPEEPPSLDTVDAEINRQVAEIKADQASILDGIFAIGAIGTFIADITTDVLVAKQHFENGDTIWFALTCTFIILPSLIMQVFSCKWFLEDSINQSWWNYMVHFFQLGTIERYIRAFWFGLRTRLVKPARQADYICYLTEWRDICLLRLFEGFLESAPQMILQLYILTVQSEFIVERDWLTATSAVVSIISLSWAIVSYSQMLRLCLNNKIFSIFGYAFQVLYRLLMVASRVVVLVLFASAFKYYIFVVVVGHTMAMFAWLSCMDLISYSMDENHSEPFLDKVFTLIVSIIYLFCFLTVHPSTTKREISIYYGFLFLETAMLMAFWFPYKTLDGVIMYAAFGVVFGGFVVGLVCMLFYYKYFHPNEDITAGWLCCGLMSRRSFHTGHQIPDDSSLSSVEKGDLVIVNMLKDPLKRSTSVGESNHQSFPLELIRPSTPSKAEKSPENGEQMVIIERSEIPGEHKKYGTVESSSLLGKSQIPQQLLPDGARNGALRMGEDGYMKDHGKYDKESRESNTARKYQGQKHQWTARVSKQKEFHRLYDKAEVLEKKTVLANLYFNDLGSVAPTGNVPHYKSNSAEDEGDRDIEGSWHVEVSGRRGRKGSGTLENREASRLLKYQRSKDDSDVFYGGVSKRGEEGNNRFGSDDKDIRVCGNLSDWTLDQRRSHQRRNSKKRYLFSDKDFNNSKCTSL